MSAARDLLRRIHEELQQRFLERAEVIDGALVALVSAQHVLLVGPPGTAKSMLADEICRRLEGARYFQWLLTRFSTPEELFGARRKLGSSLDSHGVKVVSPFAARHSALRSQTGRPRSRSERPSCLVPSAVAP